MYVQHIYIQDSQQMYHWLMKLVSLQMGPSRWPWFSKKKKKKKKRVLRNNICVYDHKCVWLCVGISGNVTLSCALAMAGKQICRKELEEVHNTLPTDTDMVWEDYTGTQYTSLHTYTSRTQTICNGLYACDNLNHLACQSEKKYTHAHVHKYTTQLMWKLQL